MMCESCKKQKHTECPSVTKTNPQLCTCQHKTSPITQQPVKAVSE